MGRIDYKHITPRPEYSKPRDVVLSIERWMYISISGYYIFDADVRDLPTIY